MKRFLQKCYSNAYELPKGSSQGCRIKYPFPNVDRIAETVVNHIVDVSVDLMPPLAVGEHFIQIEYGELLAAETWYLGAALF